MKKNFYYFLFILLLFLVQASLEKVFFTSILVPQFLIVFVLIAAASEDYKTALTLAFAAGFLAELASNAAFGSMISVFIILALLGHFLTRKFTSQEISFSTAALLVCAGTLVFAVWMYAFNLFTSGLNLGEALPARDVFRLGLAARFLVNLALFFPLQRLYRIFLPNKS